GAGCIVEREAADELHALGVPDEDLKARVVDPVGLGVGEEGDEVGAQEAGVDAVALEAHLAALDEGAVVVELVPREDGRVGGAEGEDVAAISAEERRGAPDLQRSAGVELGFARGIVDEGDEGGSSVRLKDRGGDGVAAGAEVGGLVAGTGQSREAEEEERGMQSGATTRKRGKNGFHWAGRDEGRGVGVRHGGGSLGLIRVNRWSRKRNATRRVNDERVGAK